MPGGECLKRILIRIKVLFRLDFFIEICQEERYNKDTYVAL